MNTSKKLFAGIALIAATGTASAAQWVNWDFSSSATACTPPSTSCRIFTANGEQIAVYAYSTTGAQSNGGTYTPQGALTPATLNYSGGELRISNTTGDSDEGSSPEHSIDNMSRYDTLVFEVLTAAQPTNFEWKSLGIGWAQEWNGSKVKQSDTADMEFWAGNPANTNFTSMCLSTCTANNKITERGFTHYGSVPNVASGSTVDVPGTAKGRFMVVSGALGAGGDNFFDGFKVTSVKGTPEPQSLALLAIGLAAMGFSFRRRIRGSKGVARDS